jgi:RimJ/RimL family protein N-acetyltransferase
MLLNEHVAVCTNKIVLVPYSSHHVPKYHEWMQDPDIQQATASEPLTIEEEYDMQRSWRKDADKLTFIMGTPTKSVLDAEVLKAQMDYAMVGDVNLFITTDFDEASNKDVLVGELELMIAEKQQQGKGLGRAGLLAFLQYVLLNEEAIVAEYRVGGNSAGSPRSLDYFRVKIDKDNERSLKLFAGLGFEQAGEVSYFGEIEMRRPFDTAAVEELRVRFGLDKPRQIRYEDAEREQQPS